VQRILTKGVGLALQDSYRTDLSVLRYEAIANAEVFGHPPGGQSEVDTLAVICSNILHTVLIDRTTARVRRDLGHLFG
jgi:hypothetical protein